MKNLPVGIFDSGVGGLTLVKEFFRQLPNEKIIYFGDTARVPYGTKSKETVTRFSLEIVNFLLKKKVKLIVVACNTASAYALDELKNKIKKIPIIGVIEPGARAALEKTSTGRVGLIGTEGTIRSKTYERTFKKFSTKGGSASPKESDTRPLRSHRTGRNSEIKPYSHPCPLFVPLVEEGWFTKEVTYRIAEEYLMPLKKEKIDVLLLGCTHYPLLKKVIQETVGKNVTLIDSASETVKEVKRILTEKRLFRTNKFLPRHKFYVSDAPEKFQSLSKHFLGPDYKKIAPIHLKHL